MITCLLSEWASYVTSVAINVDEGTSNVVWRDAGWALTADPSSTRERGAYTSLDLQRLPRGQTAGRPKVQGWVRAPLSRDGGRGAGGEGRPLRAPNIEHAARDLAAPHRVVGLVDLL